MLPQTTAILDRIQKHTTTTPINSPFHSTFHSEIKHKKNLSPKNFKLLKTILVSDYSSFLTFTPTKNESIVLGRAFMKIKIKDKQQLVDFLVMKGDIGSVIILYSYLCTKVKVNLYGVIILMKKFLSVEKPVLDVLKLLLIVFRNYKEWVDDELISYCRGSDHGVCKEIVREYDGTEIE